MRLSTPLILLFSLLAGAASAQAQPVTVSFRLYGIGRVPVPSGLVFKQGERYEPVSVIMASVSKEQYSYAGPRTMPLFVEGRPEARSGSNAAVPTYIPIGSVTFEGSGSFLVALTGPVKGKVLAVAIKESPTGFPGGSARVLNATPYPMSFEVGTNKADIKPGLFAVIPAPSGAKSVELHGFATFKGKRMEVVNEGGQGITANSRLSAFVSIANAEEMGDNPEALPRFTVSWFSEPVGGPVATGSTRGSGNNNSGGNRQNQSNRYNNNRN